MAAIPEHIYKLRTFIKQHSDDSIYSDELLYSLLKDARCTLLERENKKFTKDSEFHKQTICMPLIIDSYHDCECLPFEVKCKILKSKFALPKVLTGRNKELIRVLTIDSYSQIPFILSTDLKNLKYTKTKGNGNKYGIINNYLTIFNTGFVLKGNEQVVLDSKKYLDSLHSRLIIVASSCPRVCGAQS